MKKLALILTVVLIVSLLGACGDTKTPAPQTSEPAVDSGSSTDNLPAEDPAAPEINPADVTVAGIVFQEDQFMKLMQMGYEGAANTYGVKYMASNTNNDQSKEAELINTYIAQKISGIAIAPLNETSSMEALRKAHESGMEIAVGNTQLKDADFVCGGYTSDNYMLGQQTGEKARAFIEKELDGKARIAIIQFMSQLPEQSTARMNGFVDQLKDLPGVEIVADQDAWLQDSAIQVVGDILTANEADGGIDIVWAANDGGTIGATMAVKNSGKAGKTFVFGTDAAEQQVAMIKNEDNILQCVTGQDPYQIGYKTMEILIETILGGDGNYGQEVIVPGITLSRDDIAAVDAFATDLAEKTK